MPDQSTLSDGRGRALLGVCLALATGCATGASAARRRAAELAKNYDLAVVEYTKALRANPDDDNARLALDRAKLRASQEHAFRARTLAGAERYEEALVEYQLASELNPSDAARGRGAARRASEAAHEDRGDARRQDRARVADRALARPRRRRGSICRPTRSCPTRSSSAPRAAARCSDRSRSLPG